MYIIDDSIPEDSEIFIVEMIPTPEVVLEITVTIHDNGRLHDHDSSACVSVKVSASF